MKKIIYIALLLLAIPGSNLFSLGWLGSIIFNGLNSYNPAIMYLFSALLGIPSLLIKAGIGFRILVFIKNRSIVLPENYNGLIALVGTLSVAFMAVIIAGYAFFILNHQSQGLSGIPLGFSFTAASLTAVLPVAICELKSLYSVVPKFSNAK